MSGLPPQRQVNANDTDFEHITRGGQDGIPSENVDYWQFVSHEYVETMGIPVVRGRDFGPEDVGAATA